MAHSFIKLCKPLHHDKAVIHEEVIGISTWYYFDKHIKAQRMSQVVLVVKKLTSQCKRHKIRGLDPWVVKILWRRAWQPTPVFLPGESHGREASQAIVHKVTKSWTWLKWLSMHVHMHQGSEGPYNFSKLLEQKVEHRLSDSF